MGAEISATLNEKAFNYLKSPIVRVTGFDTIMPYFKNEQYYLPNEKKVVGMVRALVDSSDT